MKRALGAGALISLALSSVVGIANAAPGGLIDPAMDGESSLTIHKFELPSGDDENYDNDGTELELEENWKPLEGIEYTLYPIEGIDLQTDAGWATASEAVISFNQLSINDKAGMTGGDTFGESDGTFTIGTAIGTQTTNNEGTAIFSGLDFNLLLVKETAAPSNVTTALPFLMTVPMTTVGETSSWNYHPNIYPKNLLNSITKSVNDAGSKEFGDIVSWDIDASLPTTTSNIKATSWGITDRLDHRLDYKEVKVSTGSQEITLDSNGNPQVSPAGLLAAKDVEFKVQLKPNPITEGAGDFVGFKLTESGLAKLNSMGDDSISGTPIKMTINTSVNTSGVIPNEASLWVNNPGLETEWVAGSTPPTNPETPTSVSNTPETKWGGIKVHKTADRTKQSLAGAKFEVYGNNANSFQNAIKLTNLCNENKPCVTNDKGELIIDGLRYSNHANDEEIANGTEFYNHYWLVETQAPEGFKKLDKEIHFEVTSSVEDSKTIEVINVQKPIAPTGTNTGFIWVGAILLILGTGALVLVISRKKANTQAK